MVHVGRHARRWGANAALGIALAVLGGPATADPPRHPTGAGAARTPAKQAPQNSSTPRAPASVESAVQRIAGALEAKNRYEQSTEGQKDAHEAAEAAMQAAGWAGAMFWAAFFETLITAAGVILVALTLRQVKITAEQTRNAATAAKDALDHARKSTQQELRAYVALESIDFRWTDSHAGVVEVTWKNTGSTPTKRAITQTNFRMEDSDLPAGFAFPDLSLEEPAIVSLGPGQTRMFHVGEKIHQVDVLAVQAGKRHIHVWGWIDYNDVFDGETRHRSEFCSVLKVVGNKDGAVAYVWNSHGPFNGTDEECYHDPAA